MIKPFIALAALAEDVITPQTTYEDTEFSNLVVLNLATGIFNMGKKKAVNVESNNAIQRHLFLSVGLKLGAPKMALWFDRFRLSASDLHPYFSQVPGLIPTDEWKRKHYMKMVFR